MSMTVVDKPRPRKKLKPVLGAEEPLAAGPLGWCYPERKYRPMLQWSRSIVNGIMRTIGACACGSDLYRVGGAGGESGAAIGETP